MDLAGRAAGRGRAVGQGDRKNGYHGQQQDFPDGRRSGRLSQHIQSTSNAPRAAPHRASQRPVSINCSGVGTSH
eukprot:3373239-Rhodomonas_salina.1